MFTVNDARCTINLKQRINIALNNEQMVISSKWIYKNYSLSATVTRVSNFVEGNFVEENVCLWCVFTSSGLPVPVDSVTQCSTQQVKYVNRNALSMFKAVNKGCK